MEPAAAPDNLIFPEGGPYHDPPGPIKANVSPDGRRSLPLANYGARRTIARHLLAGFVFTSCLAGLLWYGWSRRQALAPWLTAWFVAATVVTFLYYGWDKTRARAGRGRVPEAVLHVLAAAGGSLGAYAGMRWFRHKTIKGRFRILFWMIVALQTAIVALVIKESVW